MDPRRISELSEAAARGASRKAAADAKQHSIQEAINRTRGRNSSPDVEMLDAAPLPNGFSGHNRVESLMHSGIMPGPTSLDRQASANSGATFNSGSEPYSVPRTNGLHVSTRPSHTRTQRQFSGDLTSTSYAQPPAANRLPRNFSLNQQSAFQVIDLDDDSPLPMRQRGQSNPVGNRQLQAGSFDQEDSFVDLTGESPPVAHVPISRPANRVQLDSIGSHLLRSTSSDLESRQQSSQHAQQRRPIHMSNSRHTSSNHSLGPTVDDGLYGLQSGSIANASPDECFDNEAAGYLDVHSSYPSQIGTGSERPQAQRSSRGQPARRASAQIRRSRSDQNRNTGTAARQHPAQLYDATSFGTGSTQEDMDLALAMSLAAEDVEAATQRMAPPRHSTGFPSHRYSQQSSSAGSRFPQPHMTYTSSDPMTAIAHSLLGGARLDAGASNANALFASFMAEFESTNGGYDSSHESGNGHQDMSYEALTNLEDVKLTALPELLATMPLDMCLKGGPWEDKACSICQSEYEPDEVVMILPCEHHFHKDCAMEWLGKHSKKCPICKESIGG